jgi:hypothetical protein
LQWICLPSLLLPLHFVYRWWWPQHT